MATQYQIEVGNRIYTVVNDLTRAYQALVTGTVIDELTGKPPLGGFDLQVKQEGVHSKTMDGGLFTLAGYSELIFPDLDNTAYAIDIVIQTPGYRRESSTVNVLQNASLPVTVPTVMLQRQPVRLQGRVVSQDQEPIPNAKVLLEDDPEPEQPLATHTAILRTPLQIDRSADVAVSERQFIAADPPKQLATDVLANGRTITLKNRVGLTGNDILGIGSENDIEYQVIKELASVPTDPNQPGDILLSHPLRRSHAAEATVRKVTLGPPPQDGTALAVAHQGGDGLIVLKDKLDGETIEIGEPPDAEYHALGALTDSEGFYRLNGVGGALTVYMNAKATGFVPLERPVAWTIDYGKPVNIVNFRLKKE